MATSKVNSSVSSIIKTMYPTPELQQLDASITHLILTAGGPPVPRVYIWDQITRFSSCYGQAKGATHTVRLDDMAGNHKDIPGHDLIFRLQCVSLAAQFTYRPENGRSLVTLFVPDVGAAHVLVEWLYLHDEVKLDEELREMDDTGLKSFAETYALFGMTDPRVIAVMKTVLEHRSMRSSSEAD
jgi:hypothetical protein